MLELHVETFFFFFANIFFGHTFVSHILSRKSVKSSDPNIFVTQYATFCMLVLIFVILLVSKRPLGATKVMIYWDLCKGKRSNSATKKCLTMETFVKCLHCGPASSC